MKAHQRKLDKYIFLRTWQSQRRKLAAEILIELSHVYPEVCPAQLAWTWKLYRARVTLCEHLALGVSSY